MEFCGDKCTLDRLSRESSGLPEDIVRNHTKSLLKAVEKLHENQIMHRDIKGANIFLKAIDPKHPEKVLLKLGDFGCSIKFKDPIGPSSGGAKATGFMGTFRKCSVVLCEQSNNETRLLKITLVCRVSFKAFMAPEVMISNGAVDATYTYSADIWSLGCVVIGNRTKEDNCVYC